MRLTVALTLLFFSLTMGGTADNRLDYHYFPKALVIPANSSNTTYTLTAIKDELTEPVERIDLTIQTDTHYSISNGSTQLFIGDMILGINEPESILFSIYPNPVNNYITIQSEFYEYSNIKIFNITGQLIETFNTSENNRIDVSFLNSGVYFIQLNSPSGIAAVKFIKE